MCGFGARPASKRYGSAKTSSSKLAEPYQTTTLSPSRIVSPRSSTSQVAVRRKCSTGQPQRRISSAPVFQASSGSRRIRSHSNGCSISASIPCAIACRVVSFPATTSRRNIVSNSRSVSRSPSISAWTSRDTRSSRGSSRRCAAIAWPYSKSSSAAGLRNGTSRYCSLSGESGSTSAKSGSVFAISRSPQSTSLPVSDSGTPSRRQSTRIGSSFAISSMKSNSPRASACSRISRESSRSASS